MANWRDFLNKGDRNFGSGSDRVTLTSRSPSVALGEAGAFAGTMQINLHWTPRESEAYAVGPSEPRRGLWYPRLFRPLAMPTAGRGMLDVDLDLGCLYEMADGTKGVLQPLGDLLGDLQKPPYIRISRDDRSGTPSGEVMYIDLSKAELIKRILIFVYIYDDTPAFDKAHAVVTLFPPSARPIEVRLDERKSTARSCAVALIENKDGKLTVRREVAYVYGFQSELDRLYGWGMQWQRGYKSAG
jgi:tellurite resistance protein TerA